MKRWSNQVADGTRLVSERRKSRAGSNPVSSAPDWNALFDDNDDPNLIKELRQRSAEIADRRRWVIASVLGPVKTRTRWVLWYDMSDNMYPMTDPQSATVFKLERHARLIAQSMDHGHYIVPCKVDKKGKLVPRSIRWAGAKKVNPKKTAG